MTFQTSNENPNLFLDLRQYYAYDEFIVMATKTKNNWYTLMSNQETPTMEKNLKEEKQIPEKKYKKVNTDPAVALSASISDGIELKSTIKITFEGEAAQKILKVEAELKERLSKPDMGKILGTEILTWTDQKWTKIVEENTDIEYFFAQIKKYQDRPKSIKLLKVISEQLQNENPEIEDPDGNASEANSFVATSETDGATLSNSPGF